MKVLLDTHIWIWYLIGSSELPEKLKNIIDDSEVIYLSPISFWEAIVLHERGKIRLLPSPEKWLTLSKEKFPYKEAPITIEIAIKSRILSFNHQDPADRFLAATAHCYQIPLLTCDERLRGLSWLNTP